MSPGRSVFARGDDLASREGHELPQDDDVGAVLEEFDTPVAEQGVGTSGVERVDLVVGTGIVARIRVRIAVGGGHPLLVGVLVVDHAGDAEGAIRLAPSPEATWGRAGAGDLGIDLGVGAG